MLWEAAKKSSSKKKGGGVKGPAIMEKIAFFNLFFQHSKFAKAIKLEGGRGLGLNEEHFFAASLYKFKFKF